MTDESTVRTDEAALFGSETHSNWVRLGTLVLLRWIAVAGQVTAVLCARWIFDVRLETGLVALVISLPVISNLISAFAYGHIRRLTEPQAAKMLLFDTAQLSVLLWLTGGLNNPFAVLIVVPVTVSAAALTLRSTVGLALFAAASVSILALSHLPLVTGAGQVLVIPNIFMFGFWLAILTGILFLGIYAYRVTSEQHSMSEALLATQMALSRQQKLTDLGGVVAAAAHELGTPLATIKLASAELIEELEDDPVLREDAELIREQADRCREILRSMGRAGKSDLHLLTVPLQAVIEEAAEPHLSRGKQIHFDFSAMDDGSAQPEMRRMSEVIHGLRNLIQNAVDFAEANVWVEARWDKDIILVRVIDDGPGYPVDMIGRIGDPFVRRRSSEAKSLRPEYQGMGLGLFIAKTLLERAGATLSFDSGNDPFLQHDERQEKCGAIVEVSWPAASIKIGANGQRPALGENIPIEP